MSLIYIIGLGLIASALNAESFKGRLRGVLIEKAKFGYNGRKDEKMLKGYFCATEPLIVIVVVDFKALLLTLCRNFVCTVQK